MADQQRIEGLKSDFKCFNENGDDYVTKEEFVKFFTQYCGLSEGQASDKADVSCSFILLSWLFCLLFLTVEESTYKTIQRPQDKTHDVHCDCTVGQVCTE